MTLVHISLHDICQQRKAVDGCSVQNPSQPYLTSHRMATTPAIPPFYSLFLGLCTPLFQIIAHFRLFLKVISNFYLQILADPLNLFLRHKNASLGFESILDRLWIASSVNSLLKLKRDINSYSTFSVVTV